MAEYYIGNLWQPHDANNWRKLHGKPMLRRINHPRQRRRFYGSEYGNNQK